ncbi:hypothetical protein SAMN05421805_101847 [Saccharopolyspora antimicrobica]|uniref:Uncharacterized protein n=1 Tax=Saccharopolyspora antimicrobica TaxID=455193 RepID=A0A1I4S5V4_9PSEU|nr:hypothetical protein [Saccharopolyspora antimicrobica]RKT87597.1 hypothetical protein ATL45_6017 [Saccharopolyspora antimicrobica]SFM59650.1 hypothetical protein SAMN05421805_101847 [Saccharopolyspora antimicrobica]
MTANEVEQLVRQMAGAPVEVADPGPKASDVGDEQERRLRALGRFRAALDVEEQVAEAALRQTAEAAEESVWLGASLADLSAVTGRTRQAARKRWPELGGVYRRRKWLGNHVEDITYMAGLLASRADDLVPSYGHGTFMKLIRQLREGIRRCEADFAPESQDVEDPAARWRGLDDLVNVTLRGVIEAAGEPQTPEADFALHGAKGVLGYYDHAVAAEDA